MKCVSDLHNLIFPYPLPLLASSQELKSKKWAKIQAKIDLFQNYGILPQSKRLNLISIYFLSLYILQPPCKKCQINQYFALHSRDFIWNSAFRLSRIGTALNGSQWFKIYIVRTCHCWKAVQNPKTSTKLHFKSHYPCKGMHYFIPFYGTPDFNT